MLRSTVLTTTVLIGIIQNANTHIATVHIETFHVLQLFILQLFIFFKLTLTETHLRKNVLVSLALLLLGSFVYGKP